MSRKWATPVTLVWRDLKRNGERSVMHVCTNRDGEIAARLFGYYALDSLHFAFYRTY